jgi:tetratricopeptide (TPR) repeat protein
VNGPFKGEWLAALPRFEPPSGDLLATARLLLTQRARLEKLAFREQFEVTALSAHGFNTGADARAALNRLTGVAGALLHDAAATPGTRDAALGELGHLYLSRGEPEAALECFLRAAPSQAAGRELHYGHAQALMLLGRFEDAIAIWSTATGIPASDLVAIRLLPFQAWADAAGAPVRALNEPGRCEIELDCMLEGRRISAQHCVRESTLLAAEVEDLRVEGIVPHKGGLGYYFEEAMPSFKPRVQVLSQNAYMQRRMADGETIDRPCIFLTGALWHYDNYYHFVVQNVARLMLLLEDDAYRDHGIAVPIQIRSWGRQFLAELGIAEDRLVLLPAAKSTLIRRAVVPVMRRVPSAAEMSLLRKKLGVDRRRKATRRIWVGRRNEPSHTRLLLNEPEILQIAAEFGFEEIDPGSMSIRDQIELFNDAAAICGPNGAAFTNVLYAPDGARVVCLSPRETIGTWYPDLAGMCDHRQFFWCFGSFLEEARASSLVPQMPYTIPGSDFRALLARALEPGGAAAPVDASTPA